MNIWAVILAAGASSRLSAHGITTPKQFMEFEGAPLFWRSAKSLSAIPSIRGIVFVMPPPQFPQQNDPLSEHTALICELEKQLPGQSLGILWKITTGGARRQDSVKNGLDMLPQTCDAVLVHDSARPFASPEMIMRVVNALKTGSIAVIPGIPVADTIKETCTSPERPDQILVTNTPERARLRAVQTPQGFTLKPLLAAHRRAAEENWEVTDDASIMEKAGHPVIIVPGEEANRKITTPADLELLDSAKGAAMQNTIPCTGLGYDVHRYGGNRPFILGGVPIACDIGVSAHSDGDTLLHALIDALLGCIGGGDIGGLFPDNDPAYDNISSGILLSEVLDRCSKSGLTIHHVDVTVIAQTPKISPHRKNIAANLTKLMNLKPGMVNVKATTEEHLGFTGEKKGIKVVAVVTGSKKI